MTLLLDNMYLLNKSEMSSRLNQFYGFMKTHKIENAYLYSEVYNEYSILKKIFEYIVKYASQIQKHNLEKNINTTLMK